VKIVLRQQKKKVAIALAELITTKSKKTLDILVFGNDAWTIAIKDFTVFEGGAFSYQYGSWSAVSDGFTRRKRNTNKFLITDGELFCEKMELT
jgi:uncharacterized protein with von Willebrand factor type A (vWA) domain